MSIVRIHSKSGGASLSLGVGAIFVLVFSFCLFDLNPGRARAQGPSKVVVVTKDDTVIRESCIVRFHPGKVIRDKNGDGVLHIEADGITVEFERSSILRGAPAATPPNLLTGIGIRLDGRRGVTLKNIRVHGYKVGVHLRRVADTAVRRADLSGNFAQRLLSTPEAENTADWLRPHENDNNEWFDRYGAALYVEDSTKVTIREVFVRRGQNGIVLDRVGHSKVYDNDASFLSGWGLALWRSSNNLISRNSFDFCIRGYSHGHYNRGQDSAGILLFEQCHQNRIVENSATHGGDGLFAFAGREALGEVAAADPELGYERLGNNDNVIVRNDFSYAAAHGLELTFSFGNQIVENRLVGNAICGIWGGYSQDTVIARNTIEKNGDAGYGLERGGINIEHGANNRILANSFSKNECGVHLWDDDDAAIVSLPWALANHHGCVRNEVVGNRFHSDRIALHLRGARDTVFADNTLTAVPTPTRLEGGSTFHAASSAGAEWKGVPVVAEGSRRPVGARGNLQSRNRIVITEWGPWDHASPLVRRVRDIGHTHSYEVRGVKGKVTPSIDGGGLRVRVLPPTSNGRPSRVVVGADSLGVKPYRLTLSAMDPADNEFVTTVSGVVVSTRWRARFFNWTIDPRRNEAGWRGEAAKGATVELEQLRLFYGVGGPLEQKLSPDLAAHGIGTDRFGMLASTELPLAKGKWRIITVSDDGVRVTVNGKRVIDNWTWHAPTRDVGEFVMEESGTAKIEVAHFEIDGVAALTFDIERVDE